MTLVLSLYGSTMMGAQAFEQTLAALSIALDIAAHPKPPSQTTAAFYRRTAKAMARAGHRFQRASASELRKLLPENFDPELMRDIEIMVKWRGFERLLGVVACLHVNDLTVAKRPDGSRPSLDRHAAGPTAPANGFDHRAADA
jgi:hypothetical protein